MAQYWIRVVLAASALVACSRGGVDSPDQTAEVAPPPALETVDLQALGGASILFRRERADGPASALYLVRGGTGIVTAPRFYALSGGYALSPDASQVAYARMTDFSGTSLWDLHVANADGSGERRLAAITGNWESPPAWFPDGSRIAFYVPANNSAGLVESPGFGLYRLAASGGSTGLTLLATGPVQPFAGPGPCPLATWNGDAPVAISSRGEIAFACYNGDVYVFDGRGSMSGRVVYATNQSNPPPLRVHAMAWSPDGERLALLDAPRYDGLAGELAIKIVNTFTNAVATIATMPQQAWTVWALTRPLSVCWLRAADVILFTAPDGALRGHIYMVPAGGGQVRQFTSSAAVADTDLSCTP